MGRQRQAGRSQRTPPADPSSIECRLCGEAFRAITPAHLRSAHRYRGAHPVADYKRRFGLRVAVCDETQQILRGARHRQLRRDAEQQYWSKPKLKAELRRRARVGESLASSRVGESLYAAARRAYGSWDAMLEAAGLDPQQHRITRRWDHEAILDAIRERAATHGPHALAAMRKKDEGLLAAAVRYFGDWDAAVIEAGCQAQRRPASRRKWTWDTARRWVLDRVRRGKPITGPHVPLGLLDRIRCDTGEGWGSFVQSLGVEYPLRTKKSRWTSKKVRTLLRNRERAGLPMAARAVRREAPRLFAEARRRFGSWRSAMHKVGVGRLESLRLPRH